MAHLRDRHRRPRAILASVLALTSALALAPAPTMSSAAAVPPDRNESTTTTTARGGGKHAPSPTPSPSPTPAPVPAPTPSPAPVPYGLTVPWGPLDAGALAARSQTIGTAPRYLLWYAGFTEQPDVTKLAAVAATGATPLVTWEPWDYRLGLAQTDITVARIAAGAYDAHLAAWGDALAAWGGTVALRFGHEPNGTWYPWSPGVGSTTAADYVAAYRRVHDVVSARGAGNVRWVWSPNVVFPGSVPLASVYPGPAYVDLVGLDGYNWGTSQAWSSWQSPATLLDATLHEVAALAPGVPVLVTETASSERGGDKAAWVTELFGYVRTRPEVVGVVWFDEDKETDWRIASSPASLEAFRAAVAVPR